MRRALLLRPPQLPPRLAAARRALSSPALAPGVLTTHYKKKDRAEDPRWEGIDMERFADEATDLLIVGGGPAGLSAAIRFKQLCNEQGLDYRVTLLEKASGLGEHLCGHVRPGPSVLCVRAVRTGLLRVPRTAGSGQLPGHCTPYTYQPRPCRTHHVTVWCTSGEHTLSGAVLTLTLTLTLTQVSTRCPVRC